MNAASLTAALMFSAPGPINEHDGAPMRAMDASRLPVISRFFKDLLTNCGAVLLAVLAAQGAAQAADPEPGFTVGKVQTLYVRRANGVYLDVRAMPGGRVPESAELWADVQFTGNAPHGRDFAIARLGRVKDVEAGDLVAVEFAMDPVRAPGAASTRVAPLPQPTQVILLAAKHHTTAARLFGRAPIAPAVLTEPIPQTASLLRVSYTAAP